MLKAVDRWWAEELEKPPVSYKSHAPEHFAFPVKFTDDRRMWSAIFHYCLKGRMYRHASNNTFSSFPQVWNTVYSYAGGWQKCSAFCPHKNVLLHVTSDHAGICSAYADWNLLISCYFMNHAWYCTSRKLNTILHAFKFCNHKKALLQRLIHWLDSNLPCHHCKDDNNTQHAQKAWQNILVLYTYLLKWVAK